MLEHLGGSSLLESARAKVLPGSSLRAQGCPSRACSSRGLGSTRAGSCPTLNDDSDTKHGGLAVRNGRTARCQRLILQRHHGGGAVEGEARSSICRNTAIVVSNVMGAAVFLFRWIVVRGIRCVRGSTTGETGLAMSFVAYMASVTIIRRTWEFVGNLGRWMGALKQGIENLRLLNPPISDVLECIPF